MTAPLTALLERVEAADGPDGELDIAIVMAIYPDIGAPAAHCIGDEPIFWHDPYRKQPPPLLTSSVDAALALVERVLPDWLVEMRIYRSGPKPVAFLCEPDKDDAGILDPWPERHSSNGATPPLAILAALLRALHALASRDAAGPADAEGVGL